MKIELNQNTPSACILSKEAKGQYVHTTTNTTATATFTSSTTAITSAPIATCIATTCKVKGIKMKVLKSVRIYRLKEIKLTIS